MCVGNNILLGQLVSLIIYAHEVDKIYLVCFCQLTTKKLLTNGALQLKLADGSFSQHHMSLPMFLREADGLKKRMHRIALFFIASMALTFGDRSRGTSHDRRGLDS